MLYGTPDGLVNYAEARGYASMTDTGSYGKVVKAHQRGSDYIRFKYSGNFGPNVDATTPEVIEATYMASIIEFESPHIFNRVIDPLEDSLLIKVDDIQFKPIEGNGSGLQATSPMIDRVLFGLVYKPFALGIAR